MATIREMKVLFTAEAKGIQKAFQQIRQEAAKLGPETKRSTDEANKNYDSLISSTEKLGRAIEESGDPDVFDGLNRAIQKAQDEMAETGKVSSATMGELNSAVRGSTEHLDSLGEEARASFGQIETAIADVNRDFVTLGVDNGLNNLNSDASNSAANLNDLGDAANSAEQEIDTLGADTQLDQLRTDLQTAQRQLQDLQDASNQADSQIDTLGGASQLDLLRTDLQNAQREIQELRDAANQADPAVNNLGQQNQIDQLRTDLQNAQREMDDLRQAANDADSEIEELGGDNGLDELGGSLGGIGGIVGGLGAGLIAAASGLLGFVAAGVGVFAFIKSSDDLKQAVNGLQVQTGATKDEIDEMRQSLIDIHGNNFGDGFQDIADSMASVKGATQLTGDQLKEATEQSLLLRDSFGWEVPETMNAVRTMMINFGMEAEEAMTLLAQGQQMGINGAEDLLDTFNEYSGAFVDLGFDGEQALNMIANAVDAGARNTDVAADSINEFATRIRDGSDLTRESLEAAGLDADKIIAKFEKGGPEAAEAFGEVTTAIGNIGNSAKREQTAVGLFGSMAEDAGVATVLALGDAAGQADITADTLDSMNEIKYDTIGEAVTGLGKKFTSNILIPLQDKIMPGVNGAITGMIGMIGTASEAFGAFLKGDESAEDVLMSYGLDPKEFQGVIDALNLIPHALSKIRTGFSAVGDIAKAVWALFTNQDGTAISILSQLGLEPEQISKVMGAVDAVKAGFESMLGFLSSAFDNLGTLWDSGGSSIFDTIKKTFIDIWPPVKQAFGAVVGFIGEQIAKIQQFWDENGAQIMEAVSNVFNGIMAVINFVMPLVLGIIKMVWGNIKGVISGALDIIMGIVKVFSGLFTGDFAKMWEGIKQLFMGVVEFLWNFIQLTFYGKILGGAKAFVMGFRTFFDDLWRGIVALFQGGGSTAMTTISVAWQNILRITREVFTNIGGFLSATWNSIKSILSGALNGIKLVFTTIWTAIRTATTTVFTAIRTTITTIFNAVKTFFTTILNFYRTLFQNTWTGIFNTVKTIFTNVYNFFKTIFTTILNFLTTTANTIITKLKDAWNLAFNTVKTIFTNVYNFFKTVFTNILNYLTTIVARILTAIKTKWNEVYNSSKSIFTNVFNFLKTTFTNIYNSISSIVGNIFTKVRDVWTNLKNTTSTIFGNIFTAIKSKFTDIVNAAKALPGQIGSAIGSMASKVGAGVTSVINKMASILGKGVNGVITGVNWVLGKLDAKKIDPWKVPQWAQGTKNGEHPGGPMVVGDGVGSNRGPELIRTPDGQQYLSPDTPTLTSAPKGTQVYSATDTRALLAAVPQYALGTDIWNGIKTGAGNAWEGAKNIGGKVKDVALDLFEYVKNPSGLLTAAMKALGLSAPGDGGVAGDIGRGAWNKAKSSAIEFIKGKLKVFESSQSGISLTGGNGGGFGAPFRFTSGPGPRNTGIAGASTNHKGWDWAAPIGTPIPSVTDGVGHRNGWHPLSGNFVEVKAPDGKVHRYQHNSKNILQVGQSVKKGQTIALVGDTGVGSGAHLHYEVKGYEDGGIVDQKQLAWIAEGGWAESIISHDPTKRVSQRAIWEETGRELGFDQATMAAMPVPSGDMISQVVLPDGRILAEFIRPWIDVLQGSANSGNSFMRG